jgi:glycine/D-amino acid oxidase-like deaminating enzyme
LHAELAKEHGGAERWGYRQVHCGQLNAVGRSVSSKKRNPVGKDEAVSLQKRANDAVAVGKLRAAGIPDSLDWFNADCVRDYSEMGDPSTTAQVHPYQFTTSMASLAEEKGAKIVIGSATSIEKADGSVRSVTYKDSTGASQSLSATDVVIAAGPWTRSVYPSAPISALRAHSVTIRPSKPISAYAVFTQISLDGKHYSPEIYARPNNEAYACGEGDTVVPLPPTTADVETDPRRCQDIIDHVSSISDELRDGEVLVKQACYLPNVEGAVSGPLIGPCPDAKGLFMAAGHTCWGIQNGPGTGKLMSEFIFDGKASSAKIKSLDPRTVL